MSDSVRTSVQTSDETKTRIAWVTFDFPPRQSSGVFRAIKFYKYLDKKRFEVDFITHGEAGRFVRAVNDESLLAEVSPVPAVHRVTTFIPHDVVPALRRRFRSDRHSAARVPESPAAPAHRSNGAASTRASLGKRLYRCLALTLYFPDHLFIWGWAAAFRALRLHLRRRYHLVYTTSYPESAHLAGFLLSLLGVPWVVDYRYGGPLWIKDVVGFRKSSLRERLDHRYQRAVLRRARQVITQSEQIRTDFCRVFGLDPARVVVLSSGFDESDFAGRDDETARPFAKHEREFHLLHVGTFEGLAERERGQLVETLNELGQRLRARGRVLVFHAVGSDLFSDADLRATDAIDYRRHGVVVHRRIPAYLHTADCCLLSTWTTTNGGVKGFIPSKLWEYLRSGLPILTTGPREEVWSIVEAAGVGVHLPIDGSGRGLLDAVAEELLERVRSQKPIDSRVSRYSWESRTESLQAVFLRMIDGPRIASC